MALDGAAFLALWNDVDPARASEYEDWHEREHVPERVSIPGMLSARRYAGNTGGQHGFLTLYAATSPAVFASPAYLAVAGMPTPRSLAMRPFLRNFHRVPCTLLRTGGRGIMGHAVAARFALPSGAVLPEVHPVLAGRSVHLGEAERDARFPIANAEPGAPGRTHVLLAEAGFPDELPGLEATVRSWLADATAVAVGRYALISTIRHGEVDPLLWQAGRTLP